MANIDLNAIISQIAGIAIPQVLQLIAGMILSAQGNPVEAAQVLSRIGLPADINITPADFQKWLDSQKIPNKAIV